MPGAAGHGATRTTVNRRPADVVTGSKSHVGATHKAQVVLRPENPYVSNAPGARAMSAAQVAIVKQHLPIPEQIFGMRPPYHSRPTQIRRNNTRGTTNATFHGFIQ